MPYVTAIVRRVPAATPTDVRPGARGECPSVHQPFAEVDGALVRVRVPGGILSADQVGTVATVARRGTTVEITSRANLQIRGTSGGDLDEVTQRLISAGVTHPDARADGLRNVLTSPTAGRDPGELVDTRPLVADIERRLTAAAKGSLSPKFGVLVDGGGAVHVRGASHDLCFGAVGAARGAPRMEVQLGRALTTGHRDDPALLIGPADVGDFVTAALEELAARPAARGRMGGLVALMGHDEAVVAIARRADIDVERGDPGSLDPERGSSVQPIGILAERQPGMWMVGAMPVLGRLSAETLEAVGHLASAFGDGEVRLTPWRSLLIAGVTQGDAQSLCEELRGLGLVVDRTDPALRVVACAGSTGCPSGFTDAQADGHRLIEMLRTERLPDGPSVHVSGCAKRCAAGNRTFGVTLEGGPSHGTYAVIGPDGVGTEPQGPDEAVRSAVSLAI